MNVVFNPELWLILAFTFVVLEMTLDGSMLFLLPIGIGCGFTAAGVASCNMEIDSLCVAYSQWHYVIGMTSISSILAAVLLRKAVKHPKNNDINDY